MKFIAYNENFEVQLIHNMPFDEVNGLGKTEEELLKEGALVEDIPEITDIPKGKSIVYKYRQEDNTVYYELVDRPLTLEEKIDVVVEKNKELETQLSATRSSYSDLLLELDFRVMDIEDQSERELSDLIMMVMKSTMNSIVQVILDKIEMGNYENREEIVAICDKYLSRNRIRQEEYDSLISALDKKESERNL